MRACRGGRPLGDNALPGAADRAAARRLARLGIRQRRLRACSGRSARRCHRCGRDRLRAPPRRRLRAGDDRTAVDARDVADALTIAWVAFTAPPQTATTAGTSPLPRPRSSPGRLSRRPRPCYPKRPGPVSIGYNQQKSSPGQGNVRSDSRGRPGDAGGSPRQVPVNRPAFPSPWACRSSTPSEDQRTGEPCGKAPSFFSPVRR